MESRRLFAVLVAVVAIALGAAAFSAGADESVIEDALLLSELNAAGAESAPQQQVVNGWLANDLLEVTARQNVRVLQMQGILIVLVAAVLLALVFSPVAGAVPVSSVGSHGSLIAEEERAISDAPLPVAVIPVEGLLARSDPDAEATPWTRLEGGLNVTVLERRGSWAHVRLDDGQEAWVDDRRLPRP